MASSRETNTMAEGLQRMLNEITKMKVMPDSDLEFLVQLETAILGYLRAPTPEPTTMTGVPVPGGNPAMAGAMGQVMGGNSPMQGAMPGPPMGAPVGAGNPNMDEMARMVGR